MLERPELAVDAIESRDLAHPGYAAVYQAVQDLHREQPGLRGGDLTRAAAERADAPGLDAERLERLRAEAPTNAEIAFYAGMVLDVHRTPFDTSSDVVCTELMAPPISSVLFPQDVSARTPHLRQQLNEHGYLAVELTPDRLTARFQVVADVQDAASAVSTAATWVVDAGSPRAESV